MYFWKACSTFKCSGVAERLKGEKFVVSSSQTNETCFKNKWGRLNSLSGWWECGPVHWRAVCLRRRKSPAALLPNRSDLSHCKQKLLLENPELLSPVWTPRCPPNYIQLLLIKRGKTVAEMKKMVKLVKHREVGELRPADHQSCWWECGWQGRGSVWLYLSGGKRGRTAVPVVILAVGPVVNGVAPTVPSERLNKSGSRNRCE